MKSTERGLLRKISKKSRPSPYFGTFLKTDCLKKNLRRIGSDQLFQNRKSSSNLLRSWLSPIFPPGLAKVCALAVRQASVKCSAGHNRSGPSESRRYTSAKLKKFAAPKQNSHL